jgi:hypothetical protein
MLTVFIAGVLATPIRVAEQAGFRFSAPEGHLQGGDTQRSPHVVSDNPAHHLPGKQINDNRQIQPTFKCPDVGDIRCPDLVWGNGIKLPVKAVGRYCLVMVTVSQWSL